MKVALANPEFRKQLEALGLEPVYSTPHELHDRIRNELARWTKVIKEAGLGGGLDEAESEVGAQGVTVADRLVYTGRRPWSEEWAVLEERVLPPVHGMRITVARMERHAARSGQ